MILDVDAGNTRLKWRLLADATGEVVGWGATASATADFSPVVRLPVERVRLSSVLSEEQESALVRELRTATGCQPELAVTRGEELGLTNAYAQPARLGVDRWLAMLAAHHLSEGAVCVVDAGTTLTFDAIDAQGMHLGGYIVPGTAMMMAAVYGDTGRVRRVGEVSSPRPEFGRSTEEAVSHGVLAMLLGLVRAGIEEFTERVGSKPAVWVTGGGAGELLEHLSYSVEYRRDLVLDGLALHNP